MGEGVLNCCQAAFLSLWIICSSYSYSFPPVSNNKNVHSKAKTKIKKNDKNKICISSTFQQRIFRIVFGCFYYAMQSISVCCRWIESKSCTFTRLQMAIRVFFLNNNNKKISNFKKKKKNIILKEGTKTKKCNLIY